MVFLGWIYWGLISGIFFFLAIQFFWERNFVGGFKTMFVSVLFSLFYLPVLLRMKIPMQNWFILSIWILSLLFLLVLVIPSRKKSPNMIVSIQEQVDERDALFHRFYRLKPGTPDFESYYHQHPEYKEIDDKIRALPDIANPGAATYVPHISPFALASMEMIDDLAKNVDWQPKPLGVEPVRAATEEITQRIKGYARYLGAALVGTTGLNPAYIYSHVGRSPGRWGEPINLKHNFAIAIAVEMQHEMVRHAPENPTLTETSFQYLEAAKIATVLARYIHLLGFRARAHVDANYRVMCVPIAVDAGLGELGRLGLLITPEFGPRVRLAVVTTTMPLKQDSPKVFGVQHFCQLCKKCATYCPSQSIPFGEKEIVNGVEKWRSRQTSCYHYWRKKGTDCGICLRVCPYSYPNTAMHQMMRRIVQRNQLARKAIYLGDRFFYGNPMKRRYPLPQWHR